MKLIKSQKGVTLIVLVITIVVLGVLSFTVIANIDGLTSARNKTNFEEDINKLAEAVEQYYARNKELPIANIYTNTSMLEGIKNTNDNDKYYVLDIIKMIEYNLHYGKDYLSIKKLDVSEDASHYTDVYIINKASHTIYYPKGITYDGEVHYSLKNTYSKVEISVNAKITLSAEASQTNSPTVTAQVKHNSYTDIDVQNCAWVMNTSSTPLGTDKSKYGNTFQTEEEALGLGITTPLPAQSTSYYLHVLTMDIDGNTAETISTPMVVTENRHHHIGSPNADGGCYKKTPHTVTKQCNENVSMNRDNAGWEQWDTGDCMAGPVAGYCSKGHRVTGQVTWGYGTSWTGTTTGRCTQTYTETTYTYDLTCGYEENAVMSYTVSV